MSPDKKLTRREFLIGCGSGFFGACAALGLGGVGVGEWLRRNAQVPVGATPTATPNYAATGEAYGFQTPQAIAEVQPTLAPATATRVATRPATAVPNEGIPLHAKVLRPGDTLIADWGYGPFGQKGLIYPKIAPEGSVPKGRSQLVTDFNGNNWVDNGGWCYIMPSGATEANVTIQGDAPAEVKWDKKSNRLCFTSNADVSGRASDAVDNAPHPAKGSSGISAVVLTK